MYAWRIDKRILRSSNSTKFVNLNPFREILHSIVHIGLPTGRFLHCGVFQWSIPISRNVKLPSYLNKYSGRFQPLVLRCDELNKATRTLRLSYCCSLGLEGVSPAAF